MPIPATCGLNIPELVKHNPQLDDQTPPLFNACIWNIGSRFVKGPAVEIEASAAWFPALMVKDSTTEQPFAPITVTVYVPGQLSVIEL